MRVLALDPGISRRVRLTLTFLPALLGFRKSEFVLQEIQDILIRLTEHLGSSAGEREIDGLSSSRDSLVDLAESGLDGSGGRDCDIVADFAASSSEQGPGDSTEDDWERVSESEKDK